MPTKYEKFAAAIKEADPARDRAVKMKYQGIHPDEDFRKLWPLAIGKDTSGGDVVLCYQYAGPGFDTTIDHVSLKHLRCFKLEKMANADVTTIVFNQATEGFTPPYLNFKQLKKQTCIDDVDLNRQKP
jgi:hypothetical protein